MRRLAEQILHFIGSTAFFVVTSCLFAAQACWLAITSRFPMAFDEAYHYGLIQFFAHRVSPVVATQPSAMDKYGALPQNPSLLYHYFLSWPERILNIFTDAPVIHVICLRLCNVGLMVASLVIMRKLLRLLPLSAGLSNLIVFAFAFTPIVVVLAAQINYFNLLVLATTGCLYGLLRYMKDLHTGRSNSRLILLLVSGSLLTSLVAFAFLPILTVMVLAVIVRIVHAHRKRPGIWRSLRQDFKSLPTYMRSSLLLLLVVSGSLWVQVYGVNLVRYHTPIPQCSQVLTVNACQHYYSWGRNYDLRQETAIHPPASRMNTAQFSARWIVDTSFYLFGEVRPLVGLTYVSTPYFVVLCLLGIVLTVTLTAQARAIGRENTLRLLAVVVFIYPVAVWARNYHDYLYLGRVVAVNGRYLVPVLIFGYALWGFGFQRTLQGNGKYAVLIKAGLASFVIILSLFFGGFNQYLLHITPHYGHLSPTNYFVLPDYQSIRQH